MEVNPEIKVLGSGEIDRWDKFVESHKYGTIYHTSSWGNILRQTFDYTPIYLALEDGLEIKAGLPLMQIRSWITGNRIASLPRTPYCDPLIEKKEDSKEFWQWIEHAINEKKTEYFEFKSQNNDHVFDESKFKRYNHFFNHTLNLDQDLELIWNLVMQKAQVIKNYR